MQGWRPMQCWCPMQCMNFMALHCTELHCNALLCNALHCTALDCTALPTAISSCSPSKASCLNDFLGCHCWPEVRSIIEDQPPSIVPNSLGGVHTGLDYIFFPALNWMVLSRFFVGLQDRTTVKLHEREGAGLFCCFWTAAVFTVRGANRQKLQTH